MMLELCIILPSMSLIFFKEVWQTPNQLLKAVFSDIQVPEFVAGCRALGLISKIITGPFWRVVEC